MITIYFTSRWAIRNLLEQFLEAEMIPETKAADRRHSYILTEKGMELLEKETLRLRCQLMG